MSENENQEVLECEPAGWAETDYFKCVNFLFERGLFFEGMSLSSALEDILAQNPGITLKHSWEVPR